MSEDPYADLKRHRWTPELQAAINKFDASKIRGKKRKFIKVPWSWAEHLDGASGRTYFVALQLLWLHWRHNGGAVKFANRALTGSGMDRHTKYRALDELERRGLISVDRRARKSPLVRLKF
jgi:hypothetical protein